MLAAISWTAWSKATAFLAAGARNPLIFLTYCSAAARMSSSVTISAYGGRRVLMERHMLAAYAAHAVAPGVESRLIPRDGGHWGLVPDRQPLTRQPLTGGP